MILSNRGQLPCEQFFIDSENIRNGSGHVFELKRVVVDQNLKNTFDFSFNDLLNEAINALSIRYGGLTLIPKDTKLVLQTISGKTLNLFEHFGAKVVCKESKFGSREHLLVELPWTKLLSQCKDKHFV